MPERYGHCKYCKWWTQDVDGSDFYWLGDYVAEGKGSCLRTWTNDGDPEDANSRAFARDAEAYYAALVTSPDFGCIQYEMNEQVQDRIQAIAEKVAVRWTQAEGIPIEFSKVNAVLDAARMLQAAGIIPPPSPDDPDPFPELTRAAQEIERRLRALVEENEIPDPSAE